MKPKFIQISTLTLAIIAFANTAHASMRCSNGIINEGNTSFEVLQKCGEPNRKEIIPQQIDSTGNSFQNSATVEHWVYGPSNGAYRLLKFIDGILVKIETKRL